MTLAEGVAITLRYNFRCSKSRIRHWLLSSAYWRNQMHWNKTPRHPATTPSPRRVAYHNVFERLLGELKLRDATITQMSRVGNDN